MSKLCCVGLSKAAVKIDVIQYTANQMDAMVVQISIDLKLH